MLKDLTNQSTEIVEIPGLGPERIKSVIYPSALEAATALARRVADKIKRRASQNRSLVLGIPTGTTPLPFYKELVRIHKEEKLSFSHVIIFCLDEYFPMDPSSVHSYNHYINQNFFDKVDILEENRHTLKGDVPAEGLHEYCASYETAILIAGGIDIQILGVGRTGHLGFNEPGSPEATTTRAVTLDKLTRLDAAEEFLGIGNVPRKALTMGLGTIMKAKKVYLMAWGHSKAAVVKKSLEGEVTNSMPPTIIQHHSNAEFFLDRDAASELTRFHTPWLVGPCDWDDRLIRKAVVWLCLKVNKAVLKLTNRHYVDNGLGDLIAKHGPSGQINIKVFNDLQHTITGWPGGKPGVEDINRPERRSPHPKRCLIFSPHPDDDVISMGGTLSRLVEQGHEVHVAYQTSGNVAVADEYIKKYLLFIENYKKQFSVVNDETAKINKRIVDFLDNKGSEDMDSLEIRKLKSSVRRGEAIAACEYFNIPKERLHFLDLPFYETGLSQKSPPGKDDIHLVKKIISDIKPHQIFAAGDLADPHGTHKVCMEIILDALEELKKEGPPWLNDTWLWLYRGAWQEWELDQVDMAVPISPDELGKKTKAILKHTSQKDGALFMGEDNREFWQRAEERNRGTAELYDALGMAEYEAFELFVRYLF